MRAMTQLLGNDLAEALDRLTQDEYEKLANIVLKPGITPYVNKTRAPFGLNLYTPFGVIQMDGSLTQIEQLRINGQAFKLNAYDLDAATMAVDRAESLKSLLVAPIGRQSRGRKSRGQESNKPYENLQEEAYGVLAASAITYDSLFSDLDGLFQNNLTDIGDIADELFSHQVAEEDIARFLVYDSSFQRDVVSQVSGEFLRSDESIYQLKPIEPGTPFISDLVERLGVTDASYDPEAGVLKANDRLITNIPRVDEHGVFHRPGGGKEVKYLPHYIGYFAEASGDRVERLRVVDPVEQAIDAVAIQFEMTQGDIKFQSILDVTRNLPDFDKHPYGQEILDTLKNKVVLDKTYSETNSLLAEFSDKTDDLGAVSLMILDEEAKGIIDPLGTSNGANMGKIFYLAEGVTINSDGSLNRSDQIYSPVGKIMSQYGVDGDNFNRNQMSFNAMLTSLDVRPVKVAYMEMAMWNAEDAIVVTPKGAEAFGETKKHGDKFMDLHGNKGVASLVLDVTMDEETIRQNRLEWPMQIAKDNPDIDLIVSGQSLASRLNLGVAREALQEDRQDILLPTGDVIKQGVVTMMYMELPQTAEHKSKDYGIERGGRKYSALLQNALSSKVGSDLYQEALINEESRQEHIDEVVRAFGRLGVTFKDETQLLVPGNVQTVVDAPREIRQKDLDLLAPVAVRARVMRELGETLDETGEGHININLGKLSVISPMTGKPVVDSFGTNVLPIYTTKEGGVSFRYQDVFQAIALQNQEGLQRAYENAVGLDYNALTRRDNLLKHIDTMVFTENARTDVLIPDPRLPIESVRVDMPQDRVIIHRDPVIQSGNVISMNNLPGAEPHTVQVNPLIDVMMDADHDGDTLGINGYDNLKLSEEMKDEFFKRSDVVEQINQYGRVFLGTDGHFQAMVNANGLQDRLDISFKNKTNQELVDYVNETVKNLVDSPASYGAYGISFENEQSVKADLTRFAEDGVKGNKEAIEHVFDNGYSPDENRAILKALIAKSEWTGMAGAITNNLIASVSGADFDEKIVRTAMDVTHTMTQSVLQMKKNADRLPIIDDGIKQMKSVMSGNMGVEQSREVLKEITNGLLEPEAIDQFVDLVAEKQTGQNFGWGVLNETEPTTMKFAFATGDGLKNALGRLEDDGMQL